MDAPGPTVGRRGSAACSFDRLSFLREIQCPRWGALMAGGSALTRHAAGSIVPLSGRRQERQAAPLQGLCLPPRHPGLHVRSHTRILLGPRAPLPSQDRRILTSLLVTSQVPGRRLHCRCAENLLCGQLILLCRQVRMKHRSERLSLSVCRERHWRCVHGAQRVPSRCDERPFMQLPPASS